MIYYAVRENLPYAAPRIVSGVFDTREAAEAFITQKYQAGWTHEFQVVTIRKI